MILKRILSRLSKERLGLTMITVSLVGIAVLVLFIIYSQNTRRLAEIRTEGVNLVRLLGQISLGDLADGDSGNVLEALVYASNDDIDNVLYAAAIDTHGKIRYQASLSGIFAPAFPALNEAGLWSGENIILLDGISAEIIEFYGPLLSQNELVGYVRVAYRLPKGLSIQQLPYLGTLALIVFLLTTFIYTLFRREFRAINRLNNSLGNIIDGGSLQTVSINASGELADFMCKFNDMVDLAKTRINQLEEKESSLVSNQKLVNYRRSRVEQVLESLPFGIVVFDEQGAVTLVNQKTANLIGSELEMLQSTNPSQWTTDKTMSDFFQNIKSRCHKKFAIDSVEVPAPVAKDRTLRLHTRHLLEGGGGAVAIIQDITQEALARRSRGDFVAHIAHELKTPLNTLGLYCEALQGEDGNDPSFRLDATNVISDEVERLSGLINNLLSLTKIEMGSLSLSKSLVKPRDLLLDAFETAKRACRLPGIRFEIHLPAEMNPIHADKDMLRIAINNLLTNAIKYNKPDGLVTLLVEESDETLVIEVQDTGIGIGDNDIDQIFEKFYRAENEQVRERTGHGLGLSLAKDIVQIHNGTLSVTSEPGIGTTFRLELWKDTISVRQAI